MPASPAGTVASSCYRATAGGRPGQRGCYGQRSWSGSSIYIGHQAHAVDLVRLRDGEMLVCTFPLLPVRGGRLRSRRRCRSGWLWGFYQAVSRVVIAAAYIWHSEIVAPVGL